MTKTLRRMTAKLKKLAIIKTAIATITMCVVLWSLIIMVMMVYGMITIVLTPIWMLLAGFIIGASLATVVNFKMDEINDTVKDMCRYHVLKEED